jgi:hypothetical protein
MTKEELAVKLHGCEYGSEFESITPAEIAEHGLLVVYAYSDDNVEFEGVFRDEISAYGGTTVTLDSEGVLPSFHDIEHTIDACRDYFRREGRTKEIKAVWNDNGSPCWYFETDIPHATFDVMEDKAVFCRALVIAISDLKKRTKAQCKSTK